MADKPFIARGFHGRRAAAPAGRLPPGQYETRDFPVLSAGPTPHASLATWDFTIRGAGDASPSMRWSWDELQALPHETPTVDIHCVTKWSKFDTKWEGVSVDTLLEAARAAGVADGAFVVAFCDGGYTTNLPLADVTGGKAWVAFGYDGAPLPPEHGGPARLLVPHLYFWKSAKWVRGLTVLPDDEPGFWEQLGYHDRGDPWREQRYRGDP
jgi:DMSO/TMAO reductase YedYZ molybdopterin-dependent catalytic subunit